MTIYWNLDKTILNYILRSHNTNKKSPNDMEINMHGHHISEANSIIDLTKEKYSILRFKMFLKCIESRFINPRVRMVLFISFIT